MVKQTTDKVIGKVGDYDLLRDISHSKHYKTFKATNHEGKFFSLVTVDCANVLLDQKKKLHEQDSQMDEEEVEKLAREKIGELYRELQHVYTVAKDFSHPNLPAVYDWIHDQQNDRNFLVMEYTLPVENNIFAATEGITPIQTISVFLPQFDATGYLHRQGYLHGNLRANSIRANMESPPVIKIVTFGHLVSLDGDKHGIKGTGFYVAPEVALRRYDQIGPTSDLYSLALIWRYCITRKLPFVSRQMYVNDAERLAQHIEKHEAPLPPMKNHVSSFDLIPDAMEYLISKLTEPDPLKREFKTSQDVENYCFENWPRESREMPIAGTITTR
ncbi:MAG: protein kinase [Deltaproteobacteria bacterium]|nr:protein kinase [Deltaproteobacteria bacterium]